MGQGKRRITVISISSLVLVAMVVAVTIGVNQNTGGLNHSRQEVTTSMKAIKNICEPTDYKQVCVESLTCSARNTTDPKELIRAAFQVAKEKIQEAARNSTLLQKLHKDPRTNEALGNCEVLTEAATNDLERSFDQMGKIDASKFDDLLTNLKTWLSGAITYQETCLDGFENTTGDAGEKMKGYLRTGMQLTSNGLAMVTEISAALSSMNIQGFNNRRLLSHELPILGHDEFPTWVNAGTRKLLTAGPATLKPDLVVAKDGTGKYRTINEALKDIPLNSNKTFVLYIKEGVYEEKVQFNRTMTHLMVVGDGPTKTKITGRLNFIDGVTTFHTATVVVLGDFFIAKDIGFENSAGPEKHQAVALRVGADMSIFYNCQMDGYQDTLYVHTYRQFYRNCVITGTIDFIFGDSSAVFQGCTLVVRKPLDNQANIVTARGRKDNRQPTGIVLQNCTITADPAYYPVRNQIKSYLGRPWKEFSRTIVMESFIDDLIQPVGWMPWNGTFGLDTCYYTEYNNRGPSSSKANRAQWKGVKEVTKAQIEHFTASQFIMGGTWIPNTGVPYTPGFIFPPPPDRSNSSDSRADASENSSAAPLPAPQVVTPTTAPPPVPQAVTLTAIPPPVPQAVTLTAVPPPVPQTAAPAPSPTSSDHKRGLFGMFF